MSLERDLSRQGDNVMRDKIASIEVFQDLLLEFPEERRCEVRRALRQHVEAPWRHAEERERDIADDIMAFERESDDRFPKSGLSLWNDSEGYRVTNIVPLEIDRLSISSYNDILGDFKNKVIQPASKKSGFRTEVSARRKSITDWTSQEAADALHRFSAVANKSTGSSHPSDQKLWFRFLLSAHKTRGRFDSTLLERWLIEAEEWPPDSATKLIHEYEFGMDLLDEYGPSYR